MHHIMKRKRARRDRAGKLSVSRFLAMFSLLLLCGLQHATAGSLETRNVAGWRLEAFSDDSSGSFTHCAISSTYNSGITLFFAFDRDSQWSLALGNQSWRLKPGSKYPVSYAIDGGEFHAAMGEAFATDLVSIALPDRPDLFASLRAGSVLHVQAAAGDFAFNLTGTNQALPALILCPSQWATANNQPQTNDPFSAPRPSQKAANTRQNAAEAVTLASNLLSASGISGFVIETPQDAEKILPHMDAVWTAPELAGGILIGTDVSAKDVDETFALISSREASACKGKFASTRPPVDAQSRNVVLGRLATACDTPSVSYFAYCTIFARAKGGIVLSEVIGVRNADGNVLAEKADADILNAVYSRQGGSAGIGN